MNETNMGDVPNTEESTKSGKRLRILINPKSLPEPKAPRAKLPDAKKMTMETKHVVRDFFWDKFAKSEKRARERKWI